MNISSVITTIFISLVTVSAPTSPSMPSSSFQYLETFIHTKQSVGHFSKQIFCPQLVLGDLSLEKSFAQLQLEGKRLLVSWEKGGNMEQCLLAV